MDPERDAAEALRVRALSMQLIEQHPFWGYLLLQMKVQYDRAVPAYGVTDGVHRVWLNPARTVALSTRELGFVLLHLLGHQLLAVTSRMRGRDPVLWGQASDYAVNRLIVGIAHPTEWGEPMYLPVEGALLSDAYDTLTVEAIYERVAARARRVVVDGSEWDTVVPRPDSNNESPEDGDGAGDAPTDDRGDSSASAPEWAGRLLPDHGGGVDVHLSETSMHEDTIREELLDRLEQAVALHQSQDSRGELPHGVERLVGERRPTVPWQRVLWRHVTPVITREDYDPRRPNRRWLAEGVYVPGLGGEQVALVVVALDTSGSMTKEALAAACAEIRAIASGVADLRLVVADANVQEVVTMDELEPWLRRRRPKGGGGTDHRPVFQWVADQRLHPELFIGITDLETQLPEAPPGYPVLWVTPRKHGDAPWGQVVVMG